MYRKFTADHIFNGHQILAVPSVIITDQRGAIIDIVQSSEAGEGIESFKGLLTPGFINAHCHLELSHLKGLIPENTGLVTFVQQVMQNRASSPELKWEAMMNAAAAMYKAGIVAVGDICNTSDSVLIKAQSAIRWHNFIEVSGFVDAAAQQRLHAMKIVKDQFRIVGHGAADTSFSPHAPYSVSKKLFELLNEETADQLITIHNQEAAAENDLYKQKKGGFLSLYKNFGIDISLFKPTGNSSFQSWLPLFSNHQSILSVHNTFIDQADLDFFNLLPPVLRQSFYYCVCIQANKYIEQTIPPLQLLINNNCNIVIGTDSYASNHQLNILEEIKAIQEATNYTIPLPYLLQWATINGARALQMDDAIGSFEIMKRPGIVLIEGLNNLQTTPASVATRIL